MVEPTPAPPTSPSRATNADIAAAADAPLSPAAATSPVRLSFGGHDENKRQPSPNRGTKSPKKKLQRLTSSPRRRALAARQAVVPASVVADTGSSIAALFDTPRASPTTIVTIDPERSKRLATIIKSIKTKPISAKRAILPRKKTPKKPAVPRKKKAAPQKKSTESKQPPPKKKVPKGPVLTAN
jgi:hypothetical protein